MLETKLIQLTEHFPEVREFSHSKTHSAKVFVPSFDNKLWTSILYIERGNFRIRYDTGEVLNAKGGTFYYHPPLSLKYQTEDKIITPYSMYHLAVDLSCSGHTLLSTPMATQQVIQKIPAIPFVRSAPALMISSFKTIFQENNDRAPGYLIQIENSLRQIMISAIRNVPEPTLTVVDSKKSIQKVDSFLDQNIEFMGPVEHLFELMAVSRSHGYEIFHTTFGIGPKEYLLRKKIVLAKAMLLDGKDIGTIAFSLGFSSSQNFATLFKKLTCITPTEFKKSSS